MYARRVRMEERMNKRMVVRGWEGSSRSVMSPVCHCQWSRFESGTGSFKVWVVTS